ncbi:MAG: aldehyde ferredoxin oxidoreductase, partial [Deltaproteobacteria bacterium]|nr:aldehyde ferredoxin oxidoreductase [Deltaproteobacteria bacterium]
MEKIYGWTGRLLRVELSSGEINKTKSMDYVKDFIGGRMLAARIYWDEVSKDTGALEAENVLEIIPGPLTGTPATACSRWVVSAKSPHSYPDQYGFGNAGGFLGAALKHAG